MSKSLGNGVDPLDLIDEHGADGTRFGLLAMSSTQDVRFSEREGRAGPPAGEQAVQRVAAGAAARCPTASSSTAEPPRPRAVEDAWILSRLQRAKAGTARAIEAFEFHRAALGLYDFVYGELCDWYLEIVKPRLYADDNEDGRALRARRARRDARDRASGDPVRDRGALVAHARRRRPADGARAGRPPTSR